MLNRQTHISSNESSYLKLTKHDQKQAKQHGKQDSCVLLSVPAETLTGITSYLDPPSLLSLARVNSWLNSHVEDDRTWWRAFVCQFLNIGPESDIHNEVKSLMLRRSENSWRSEFIVRYKLLRRWTRSRNTSIAHIPVCSEISSMYMMSETTLLASSIRYGVVARSLPFNGKVLPGYLDTSGVRIGQGIGNPNAEFNPNVSACAVTSDGGTAKILWGFRHGEVAVVTAPRAIDPSRRLVTDMVRCDVREEHVGAVLDTIWDVSSRTVVATSGADATVKIWDATTLRCLWTSERKAGVLVPDAYLKVALSVAQGTVAAVARSGEISLWTGFEMQSADLFSSALVEESRIPCPIRPIGTTPDVPLDDYTVSFLHIDNYSTIPTILVAYEDDPNFYRLRRNGEIDVEVTVFGDASFGTISTLVPFFSTESSFVLVGDTIGYVNIYDWSAPYDPLILSTHCIRKFEAHEDGAGVTAIAWNGLTLVTGSARGTSHVWDGLTFGHLKSFPSPVPRVRGVRGAHVGSREREPARQILLGPEKDVVLVSVGDRVLAWKAGPVPRASHGGVRGRQPSGVGGKKKKERPSVAKYPPQSELRQTVSEIKSMLKQESDHVHRVNGKAREQRVQLETMGLNENEAVEYLLMLSRDEALQHENVVLEQSLLTDEGIFEVEIDHDQPPNTLVDSSPATPSFHSGASTPRAGWATCVRSEATDETTPSSSSRSSDSEDNTHFPAIRATPSSSSSIVSRVPSELGRSSLPRASPPSRSSGNGSQGDGIAGSSVSGSPRSITSTSRSAWSTPLQTHSSTSTPSPSVSASSSIRSSSARQVAEDRMDAEMKFAIELSLAEAMSLGQDV